MVDCIRDEIIPFVESKYHTIPFRSYLGHSYAASYGNYLFQYEPSLFSGYLLMGAERIGPQSPAFELTPAMKNWVQKRHTFYYLGVGKSDMERRLNYGKEIADKVKAPDSTHFAFRFDTIEGGDHTNIITLSLQRAINHLYQFYTPYQEVGPTDHAGKVFEVVLDEVVRIYHMSPLKTPTYYNRFLPLAIEHNDTTSLKAY
ncbi:hypothetical protein [Paraflavitalea pollutisoli]|uniref:hypothetical protein n=1 Tax=Paraflavitalea pollutisoli TaxID=3034143 RepID=UPI0023EC9963|nr:hypothetical protein [Paraflavitalea sp. H1-2-19X]